MIWIQLAFGFVIGLLASLVAPPEWPFHRRLSFMVLAVVAYGFLLDLARGEYPQ